MEWLFPLIGGLGMGSILKGLCDHFLNNKSQKEERFYREKREAYLGLIEALHQSDVHPSLETAKNFGNWTNRCKLFGSPGVIKAAHGMIDTSNDVEGEERKKAYSALFEEMRRDMRP